jgi:hypothetical protein
MLGECKIDHSHEDVRKKYDDQATYLPEELKPLFENFFAKEHTQEILNEMFHLLKKYDLATEEEKDERNRKLYLLVNNA